ncbi:MAG: cell cycle transcriptional regulator TrcR, partial [Candidatus Puniceispirillaceae bacterium]
DAIAWLVKHHPELSDAQIGKLIGTTKDTITKIRERTHWNIANIQPKHPAMLGLCRQPDLNAAIEKAGGQPKQDAEQVANLSEVP